MLKKTVTSTISHGNVVRVSSTFEDGTEMVEEFDKVSELLTLRKVRRREQIALTAAGGASSLPSTLSGWSVEVGHVGWSVVLGCGGWSVVAGVSWLKLWLECGS